MCYIIRLNKMENGHQTIRRLGSNGKFPVVYNKPDGTKLVCIDDSFDDSKRALILYTKSGKMEILK